MPQSSFDFESAAKAEALGSFEDRASGLLAEARRIAHRLARDGNAVTVDLVRSEMEARGDLPPGYPRDFLGALFLERGPDGKRVWTRVNWKPTATRGCKARNVGVWRLA